MLVCVNILTSLATLLKIKVRIFCYGDERAERESYYLNTQSWTKILGPVDFVYTLADAPYHVRAL